MLTNSGHDQRRKTGRLPRRLGRRGAVEFRCDQRRRPTAARRAGGLVRYGCSGNSGRLVDDAGQQRHDQLGAACGAGPRRMPRARPLHPSQTQWARRSAAETAQGAAMVGWGWGAGTSRFLHDRGADEQGDDQRRKRWQTETRPAGAGNGGYRFWISGTIACSSPTTARSRAGPAASAERPARSLKAGRARRISARYH